jgi:predicted nucleic acid-binding protein
VLECALAGNADYIVTDDAHLLDLKGHQGVVTVNPAGFQLLTGLYKKG